MKKTERIGRKKIAGKKNDYISGDAFELEVTGDGRTDESVPCGEVEGREDYEKLQELFNVL